MAPVSEERAYYRPVRIVGTLLVVQALGLGGLVLYWLAVVSRQSLAEGIGWSEVVEGLLSGGAEGGGALIVVLFVPSAALMLLSGMWFLLRRKGWVVASVSQGLCLGACLLLYTGIAPAFVYPVMAYCVLTILYLNSRDVRTIMHAPIRLWPGSVG
ncbi:hypothetical protein [Rubrobacter aplysinae]|uniref:hypothetical protein n=1 Tax=Rubrobacter aplysinae TaxID=909625 RepID=UPI00128C600E|nr:hypothetical protein [Rubrobacter aplysinae]